MSKPKYAVIVEYIKDKIAKAEWAIGSQIPSQRELASQFQVNRSTVITALDELMADGLIEGVAGKGTIITNNTWTLMGRHAAVNWNDNVALGIHQASMNMVQEINEAESDPHFIQLSKGELSPDMFPLQTMKSIVRNVSEKLIPFGYEEPQGNRFLRESIADYLSERGVDVSPSSVLVVSGALQALHLISIGLLQQGSTVFLEKPSYVQSLSVFQSAGMTLKPIPMDAEGLRLDMTSPVKQKGKHVLYTNPTFHNPTGTLMPEQRRRELMAVCEKQQLPIIEDDVYRDLWIDAPPPPSLKSNDNYGNVLHLGSLSKTLSPGLRIGWVVGPESVISRLADLKMQSDYGSSTLSQLVAAEWLASGAYDDHLGHVRNDLTIRRRAVLEALETYLGDDAEWEIPRGGFFIWVRLNAAHHTGRLFQKAYARGIILNPGSIYAAPNGQYIRMSYANAGLEELEEGIYQLGQLMKQG
ncbi:PLP-dependent aminotransferase family protein [Lentibacillus halophilus]|uniref:PLP-dependent aminotransferase family protein n=1 Tax=Lentibacillus halophilus TaxID=295065 RepID=A0ABN0ZHE7_9BACI